MTKVLKDRLNIAEPEKALLDQIYLVSLGKGILNFDEMDFKMINAKKLLKWSLLFPSRVEGIARRLIK